MDVAPSFQLTDYNVKHREVTADGKIVKTCSHLPWVWSGSLKLLRDTFYSQIHLNRTDPFKSSGGQSVQVVHVCVYVCTWTLWITVIWVWWAITCCSFIISELIRAGKAWKPEAFYNAGRGAVSPHTRKHTCKIKKFRVNLQSWHGCHYSYYSECIDCVNCT